MSAFGLRALVVAALAAGTGLLCEFSPAVTGGGEPGVVMRLPATLAGMVSEPREPDAVERRLLPRDTEFAKALYRTPGAAPGAGDAVHCAVVLSGAERRSIHRPEVCLQGQGWTILESRVRSIGIGGGRELRVRDLLIRREVVLGDGTRRPLRAHFFYWFAGQDRATPDHLERIWLTLRDNITRGVNHRWAYVSVLALVTEDLAPREVGERSRDSAATVRLLEGFVRELVPRFQKSFMDNPPVAAAN